MEDPPLNEALAYSSITYYHELHNASFYLPYKFGKPLIIGVVVTLLFAGFFEASSMTIPVVRNIIESTDTFIQLSILGFGVFGFIGLNILALKLSIRNYERIN